MTVIRLLSKHIMRLKKQFVQTVKNIFTKMSVWN